MNKVFLFIVLFGFFGCDTSDNIKPLGEDYFIKFYGAIGDQEGVSVKATLDGGFIIGGNSTVEFGGQSDYLLIKVDAFGNQEWFKTYDNGGDDRLTDVIVETNGYVLAGTSVTVTGDTSKIIVKRVDQLGQELAESDFSNDILGSYKCNGIASSSTGGFIIVGDIVSNTPAGSVILTPNLDFSVTDSLKDIHFEGNASKETTFVKGFEVLNHNEIDYLVLGFTPDGTELFQYNIDFDPVNTAETVISPNSQVVDAVQIDDFKFMVLTTANNESELSLLAASGPGEDFIPPQSSHRIRVDDFNAVSLLSNMNNDFIVSGNINELTSTNTSSTILESATQGTLNWQRIFGTDFSYKSGKVIVLTDGSVVYTGTAGLKDQTKVFLIKLKNNGEMK